MIFPFQLDKDLVIFDVETTGPDVYKDRIIQIALVKIVAETQELVQKQYLVNPLQPISKESIEIHGITNEMVKNELPFKLIALELYGFIGNADLAGYNSNRFDIPLLIEEFARTGFDFSTEGRRLIDALQIFYKLEPRTLKAAMQFYCKESFENAHDAMADTLATMKVLVGQIDFYKNKERELPESGIKVINPLGDSLQTIHEFININDKRVDFTGRFVRNENDEIIFNFGNQKGNLAYQHPNVLRWIIDKDFPLQVKNIAQAILTGKLR